MTARSFYYRETDGIRVTVRPVYLRDHSEPSQSHYVFAYFVRIEDVGEQPTIMPGAVHEYQSFCILKSGEGWMEGHYGFIRQDGTSFEAAIPRFTLSASESTSLPS